MKKIITTFLLTIIVQTILAQRSIGGLIKAEKDFASYSVAHSTKEAFLKYLDSTGIVFYQGKAVNGIDSWNKKEKRPGILRWTPQFAEIANSNDFGYTTGPWTFQASANDTIAARGQYTTIWHIDKNGEWKFLIDLGVNNTPADPFEEVKTIITPNLSTDTTVISHAIPHIDPMIGAENDFIKLFTSNKSKAYEKYLSRQSILSHNGFAFAVAHSAQQVVVDSTSSFIQYVMDGWNISSSGDMSFVYGRAMLNGKTENYQRIWRHEKDGWKIALEVLRY